MKICRFDENRLGLVRDGRILDVTEALSVLPACRYPFPAGDQLVAHLPQVMRRIEELAPAARAVDIARVRLLSPIANPGKVIGAPVNYRKHLEEARADPQIHHQNQVQEITRVGMFLKAGSSVAGPAEGVRIKHLDRRNDHEIELAAIIGKQGKDIPVGEALSYVSAYCIGLDMTTRGPEERSLRKSVDTYSVLGPWLVTADEVGDPAGIRLELRVNGEVRQRANTDDLVLSVPQIIAFASSFYTLHPGDVIFTGTPEGVGPVQPGDVLGCSIERIGEMTVHVRHDSR
jgi:2,4-diketo-3-deoxy-L-fuconate hydrolase